MCVYSAIGPMFEPILPLPKSAPEWNRPLQWEPVPLTGLPISPEDLRALLDAFHKAVAAAKAADRATGQPDCTDHSKVHLEDRVAEIERRLARYETRKDG